MMATPVISNGVMFIRTDEALYSFAKSIVPAPATMRKWPDYSGPFHFQFLRAPQTPSTISFLNDALPVGGHTELFCPFHDVVEIQHVALQFIHSQGVAKLFLSTA